MTSANNEIDPSILSRCWVYTLVVQGVVWWDLNDDDPPCFTSGCRNGYIMQLGPWARDALGQSTFGWRALVFGVGCAYCILKWVGEDFKINDFISSSF